MRHGSQASQGVSKDHGSVSVAPANAPRSVLAAHRRKLAALVEAGSTSQAEHEYLRRLADASIAMLQEAQLAGKTANKAKCRSRAPARK